MEYAYRSRKISLSERRTIFHVMGMVAIFVLVLQILTLPITNQLPSDKFLLHGKIGDASLYKPAIIGNIPVLNSSSLIYSFVDTDMVERNEGSDLMEEETESNSERKGNERYLEDEIVGEEEIGDPDNVFEVDLEQNRNKDYSSKEVIDLDKISIDDGRPREERDREPEDHLSSVSNQAREMHSKADNPVLLQSGSVISDNLTVSSKPLVKKMRCNMPPKTVMTISEMNQLLLRKRASSPKMKPQWSTIRDQELVSAKSQILNAPIIRNSQELYAPLYRNVSMFKSTYFKLKLARKRTIRRKETVVLSPTCEVNLPRHFCIAALSRIGKIYGLILIFQASLTISISLLLSAVSAAPSYTITKMSYELMERILKVYVYKEGAQPIFHQPVLTGIYASEGWFMKLMEGNKIFVVKDQTKAHLFYMPFSTRMIQHSLYVRNSHNRTNLALYLKNYANMIAAKYSFWNRTSGADHFFVGCHDWAPYETRHHMERCVKALCNADVTVGYKIGKDVSFPQTYMRSDKNPLSDIGGKHPSERSILAFFAGNMHGYLRPILLQHWENKDPDMKIFGPMPRSVAKKMNYIQHMKSSKYCICAKGYEVNSPRVVEAILYECVPVIISDNFVPPFFDVLNWEAFAVLVAEKDIPKLKEILLSIPQEKYLAMQMGVKKVQQHFLWHRKPVKYDLFHMTLHSIWYNRLFQIKPR